MATANQAFLLLGGNIGDRSFFINKALQLLGEKHLIVSTSSVYETAAWGDRIQQPYLNCAVHMEVNVSATELFKLTRNIEVELGRREKGNFEPRTIDIDILFYGDKIIQSRNLTIPHERLHLRKFVLIPMNEIAPNLIHPVFNKSIRTLLLECEDQLPVEKQKEIKA
jgi:2-amino-4-hydroxy-6-hydroxymethyldihydropteridine diphosphokinase